MEKGYTCAYTQSNNCHSTQPILLKYVHVSPQKCHVINVCGQLNFLFHCDDISRSLLANISVLFIRYFSILLSLSLSLRL